MISADSYGSNIPPDGVMRITYTLAEMNRMLMRALGPLHLRRRVVKKRIARLAREWKLATKRQRDRHDACASTLLHGTVQERDADSEKGERK